MRHSISFGALLLISIILDLTYCGGVDAVDLSVIAQINKGVYRVAWERPAGRTFHGTAFAIGDSQKKNILLTAGHVVKGGRIKGGQLITWGFYPEALDSVSLVRHECFTDIGEIISKMWAPGEPVESANFPEDTPDFAILNKDKVGNVLKLAKTPAQAGETLYIFCCEGALPLKTVEVKCLGGFKGKFGFNPPLGPGASGSPVLNVNGDVVGMVICVSESLGYASDLVTLERILGFREPVAPLPFIPSLDHFNVPRLDN